MTNLAEKAAEAKAKMAGQNPGDAGAKSSEDRKRIPLSVPQRKLETPDIPGYYLRWFKGTAQRLAQAERAGFEYVEQDEVQLNDVGLGGDGSKAGSADLGSRVSIVEGGEVDGGGNAIRMYLMKQKLEHHLEDQAISQKRNDSIADTLTAGYAQGQVGGRAEGETAQDAGLRYVDKTRSKIPDLFKRKTGRGR